MYSTPLLNGQKKGLWRTVNLWLMVGLRRMEPSFENWIERFPLLPVAVAESGR
jgi:hypothetical protein